MMLVKNDVSGIDFTGTESEVLSKLKEYYSNNDDSDAGYREYISDLQNSSSVQEFVDTFNSSTDRYDNGSNLVVMNV